MPSKKEVRVKEISFRFKRPMPSAARLKRTLKKARQHALVAALSLDVALMKGISRRERQEAIGAAWRNLLNSGDVLLDLGEFRAQLSDGRTGTIRRKPRRGK